MTKFTEFVARIPRLWLFAIAGLIQVVLIALMVGDRVRILRTGTEVMLHTQPVDPRDLLRGDYVILSYDITRLPSGALKDTPVLGESPFVFVKLAPKADGFYQALSVHREPVAVASGEVLIRGRVSRGSQCTADREPHVQVFCDTLMLDYGIESFFVPQGEGRELENARNERKLAVIAAVAPGGRAAIKRLLLDGKQVYDEPLF